MAHQAYEYDPYYLQYHQQPPPPPPQDYGGGGKDRGISTLFVSGLPDDIKPREIHNLFRRRPGFDNCQLKYTGRGNQVVAFVTFLNHQSALAALHQLNGVKFDPQSGSNLHIELARSNSRRKHTPGAGYVIIDRRNQTEADAHETSSDDGNSEFDEPPGTKDDNKGDITAGNSNEAVIGPNNVVKGKTETTTEGAPSPACCTLFIANLGPTCTEEELKQVFSQYPGFNVLKIRARGGMPVAFADFEDVEIATKVMNELQGTLVASSDRGGMHLEYARSKMRKP